MPEGKVPASSAAAESGKGLLDYRAMSDTDYDLAKANYKVAQANVLVGERTIDQSAASRDMAKTNLDYCTIASPVEGMVIDRRVNIGQTVVAALNAPSLFLLAKDLTKMEVWASVNEADIGKIRSRKEMPARFTVDAYPGETFYGKVTEVRLNAADDAERGPVHRGRHLRQLRPEDHSLLDGEPPIRGRAAEGGAAGAQRGTPLETAA